MNAESIKHLPKEEGKADVGSPVFAEARAGENPKKKPIEELNFSKLGESFCKRPDNLKIIIENVYKYAKSSLDQTNLTGLEVVGMAKETFQNIFLEVGKMGKALEELQSVTKRSFDSVNEWLQFKEDEFVKVVEGCISLEKTVSSLISDFKTFEQRISRLEVNAAMNGVKKNVNEGVNKDSERSPQRTSGYKKRIWGTPKSRDLSPEDETVIGKHECIGKEVVQYTVERDRDRLRFVVVISGSQTEETAKRVGYTFKKIAAEKRMAYEVYGKSKDCTMSLTDVMEKITIKARSVHARYAKDHQGWNKRKTMRVTHNQIQFLDGVLDDGGPEVAQTREDEYVVRSNFVGRYKRKSNNNNNNFRKSEYQRPKDGNNQRQFRYNDNYKKGSWSKNDQIGGFHHNKGYKGNKYKKFWNGDQMWERNQKYFGNQYQYKNPRYNNKNNRSKDRFNPYYNKGNKGMNKGKSREGGGYYGQRGAPPDQNYYNIGDPYQFIRTPLPMSFVGQPSYIPTSSVGQNSYGVPLGYVSPSGSYMPQGFRY